MISYNPKDWFGFIFKFHKADTFRELLPLIIGIGIYSTIVSYLELHYLNLSHKDYVKNITLMHSLLGFVISLLLVFRTNTAYDRWWEGRRQWGSLVNNSRNLAVKLSAILTEKEDKIFFKKAIPNFAQTLNLHLKDEKISHELFEEYNINVSHKKHKPNQLVKLMSKKLFELKRQNKLTEENLLFINPELTSFLDICGACERIKNTPIPFSYSVFLKKFIFFYVMTLPFGYVFSLGYYTIPVVIFIFYVLASLELIAEEIEDPFGNDENDLPTAQIAENIKKNIDEIL
ncbi:MULTISPECIES: bestrophin family protein [Flavobacterium]|uniref:Bestrophin family ion channel n=1 Tax=Flavobacterium hankyongi TaxID=1176532 RepID=A0ABP8ZJ64_9FLAO|nr:bestrophin family ion channel [Flavobacterium sp. N1846]